MERGAVAPAGTGSPFSAWHNRHSRAICWLQHAPHPTACQGLVFIRSEFMGRLLTLFHWRVGFSSSQPPVLGKHLILGPVAYILVVLEGWTGIRHSYFLSIVYNWLHSVRKGAWASQLDRSSWGSLVSCSLSVQLAHVTSPTPLLSSAALPEEQIIIPNLWAV